MHFSVIFGFELDEEMVLNLPYHFFPGLHRIPGASSSPSCSHPCRKTRSLGSSAPTGTGVSDEPNIVVDHNGCVKTTKNINIGTELVM